MREELPEKNLRVVQVADVCAVQVLEWKEALEAQVAAALRELERGVADNHADVAPSAPSLSLGCPERGAQPVHGVRTRCLILNTERLQVIDRLTVCVALLGQKTAGEADQIAGLRGLISRLQIEAVDGSQLLEGGDPNACHRGSRLRSLGRYRLRVQLLPLRHSQRTVARRRAARRLKVRLQERR